ncbi:MAG: hypothetical protein GEU73_11065 [Chloroflexi bacterium]|nr:hypothetical protein [Chloroflexota bacterium]
MDAVALEGDRPPPGLARGALGDTWRNLRHELDRLHAGEFSGNTGRVLQRNDLTECQQAIFDALEVGEPPRFLDFTLPDPPQAEGTAPPCPPARICADQHSVSCLPAILNCGSPAPYGMAMHVGLMGRRDRKPASVVLDTYTYRPYDIRNPEAVVLEPENGTRGVGWSLASLSLDR